MTQQYDPKAVQAVKDEMENAVRAIHEFRAIPVQQKITVESAVAIGAKFRSVVVDAIDQMVTTMIKDLMPPTCLKCTRGGPCCVLDVAVSLADGLVLVDQLHRNGRLTPVLLQACRARHKEQRKYTIEEWARRKVPCLFLKDGRCSVYRVRPVSCAGFYTCSPQEMCGEEEGIDIIDPAVFTLRISVGSIMVQHLLGIVTELTMATTLPGAVWALGKAWEHREDTRTFRRVLQREWDQSSSPVDGGHDAGGGTFGAPGTWVIGLSTGIRFISRAADTPLIFAPP